MSVVSRVAKGLSLVAGGAVSAQVRPALPDRLPTGLDERWHLPAPSSPTLSEIFAAHPRDGGWAGFLLAQLDRDKPLLWIQDRMAILESGRVHPPGLPSQNLIHVEARDAKDALWAMEEGVRCACLSAVIGELWGDPRALDFTATRRLAVASERSGTPCWLVRLGGIANLSGARMRWRIGSAPSLLNSLDGRAPGLPAWDAELFRARGAPPGRWSIACEADHFHLVAASGDRALGEVERLRA
ncbi:ImuA family protein [Sphingomonas sp. URHD0057]|uniref:ImuA family protein n=1 Tax=Sphingomonas sp. URHD0057 TaxID=1380389 RepID=UPI001E458A0B|nr:recA-like protein [Sphingomonas sp. URHD0057]